MRRAKVGELWVLQMQIAHAKRDWRRCVELYYQVWHTDEGTANTACAEYGWFSGPEWRRWSKQHEDEHMEIYRAS